MKYFRQATKSQDRGKSWSLATHHAIDLVPAEQADLVQDAWQCFSLSEVQSADARACISLTRPYSCFVSKRKKPGSRSMISTQDHQSGELSLRPLTPAEDDLRGMNGNLVFTPEVYERQFKLKSQEAIALAEVLPWLHEHNP
eukprot:327041-Karenia_brevis.AAC.1